MTKFYSDLGKPARKLLSDDYVESSKIKVKSYTGNGVSYTVCAEQGAPAGPIDGDVAMQFPVYENMGKLTAKLYTSGRATAELTLDDLSVKGLTATALYGVGKDVGVGTLEFKHGPFAATAAYDAFGKIARNTFAAAYAPAGSVGFFVAGIDAELSTTKMAFDKVDLAASYYDGSESEATVHVSESGQRGSLSYSHHVRPGFSVASAFKYDKVKDASTLQFGGAALLDNSTVVKAKIDSHGIVGMSYVQEIRAKTMLILSTKFDVTSLDTAKVGISLALD